MNDHRKGVILFVLSMLLLPTVRCVAAEQYKLIARDAMAKIVDGNPDAAIRTSEAYLANHPKDLESLYVLAVAHAQKGDIEKSSSYVTKALDGGLPFARFQAGPRDLLKPLAESEGFRPLVARHGKKLLHGPLLSVTDTAVRCWVRSAREVPVQVKVTRAGSGQPGSRAANGKTSSGRDYTTVLAVHGLASDTLYDYIVTVDGTNESRKGRFRTFPVQGKPAKFEIGFGGGAGYTPEHEHMWNTIASHNLTAFLFLGDNVYIDHPTRPAVQRYCYYRRQSRPEFRDFAAKTPVYAIWDDHDFTEDDGWGGPQIDEPAWKVPVWRTFRNNWVNPYYGGGPSQPGCWFDFAIADVDFFMLDGRYYRDKAARQGVETANPSMLGAAQKKWLFEKLWNSKATFKVIASPVPWSFGAKPGRAGMDTWKGFKEEREEIFSFLERNKIAGVILLSADRHRSDLWKIERPNSYPLYEFESSRLTNIHTHGIMPGSLFGYNEKCSFGVLAFDTTRDEPTVTYRIVNIDNEVIHTFVVRRSHLTAANQN